MEELAIMSKVPEHPNVVQCYGGSIHLPNLFIVEVSRGSGEGIGWRGREGGRGAGRGG